MVKDLTRPVRAGGVKQLFPRYSATLSRDTPRSHAQPTSPRSNPKYPGLPAPTSPTLPAPVLEASGEEGVPDPN